MLEHDHNGDLLFPTRSAAERGFHAGDLPEGRQALGCS
jgi:hypothetical protein